MVVILPVFINAQSLRSKVNEGNKHYHAKKYEQALGNYSDALLDDPLNEKALFNKADALYKMEKYKEAREEYQKLLATKDLNLASKVHYNIGNTFFKENKLPESIDSYKKALDFAPDDFDAKYNLELARAKLKEQSKKQKQSPNQQNQQQQGQQKQDDQKKGQQDQKKKEQQKQQQDQQQQQKEQQAKKQQGKQDKNQISKKEAERILNALREDEKDAQKNKAPIHVRGRRTDKDW